MTDEERYEQICKPWMMRMEKEYRQTTTEILHILKGKEGAPGIVDDVRAIKEARAGWGKVGWIVLTILIGQIAMLLIQLVQKL